MTARCRTGPIARRAITTGWIWRGSPCWMGLMQLQDPHRQMSDLPLNDPVNTAPRAGQNVLGAFDVDAFAQDGLEQCQLGTAEALAGLRRDADRAVILDQQQR